MLGPSVLLCNSSGWTKLKTWLTAICCAVNAWMESAKPYEVGKHYNIETTIIGSHGKECGKNFGVSQNVGGFN